MLIPTIANVSLEQQLTQGFLDIHFTPQTGVKVNVNMAATLLTTDYASQVQLYLTTNDSSMDIFMIDVVWPADFSKYLVDLKAMIPPELSQIHNPAIWENNIVYGRHVAVPLFADYGVFYYRDDLLAKYGFQNPPATWDEMEEMVQIVTKHEPTVVGYVAQFNAYEGLTCNIMEWLLSADAGSVLYPNLTVTLDNRNAREILNRTRNWFINGVTPKYALTYAEADAREKFQSGNALFMRHWPSASKTMQQANVPFSFKMTGLPGSTNATKFAATLGGWNLALSKATKNVNASVAALLFMATAEFQKFRFLTTGLLPTVMSLYEDPDVCAHIDCKMKALKNYARSRLQYLEISRILYTTINTFLSQKMDLDTAIETVVFQIEQTIGTYSQVIMSNAEYTTLKDTLALLFVTLSVFGIVSCLCLIFFITWYRRHQVMVAASPEFLTLIHVGLIIEFSSIFLYVVKPNSAICIIQPFVLTMGYAVAYSALMTKTWRVYRIFDAKFAKVGQSLTFFKLIKYVGLYIFVNLTSHNAYLTCESAYDTIFISCLFSLNGLMLVFGSWLAYKTRQIDEVYRESFYIAIIMYNTLIWGGMSAGLVFIDALGNEVHFAVRSVSILMACFGTLVLLMGPKLKAVFYPVDPEVTDVFVLSDEPRSRQLTNSLSGVRLSYSKSVTARSSSEGVQVKVDYRCGSSTMFLSNWQAATLRIFESSDGMVVVLTKTGKQAKLGSRALNGFALAADENVQVVRMEESGGELKVATALVRLPDGGLYEFMSDVIVANKMLIPTDNRKKIYQYLFQEGVMVAKKDFNLPKHNEVDVPNLHVIKALQSLESRGLVNTRFSWQYYYYFLNDAGIEYLRKFLHLPVEIVPRTHIKTAKPAGIRPGREERPQRERREGGDGYRRRNDGEKKEGASGDFRPEFRGGVGRGGPRPAQE
ncbi:hypothetical protein HDU81_009843 [Chytriomyces hyalinus]|nr:hypothetical protein HDU81_009843 [Chytriomyces hyalinus]